MFHVKHIMIREMVVPAIWRSVSRETFPIDLYRYESFDNYYHFTPDYDKQMDFVGKQLGLGQDLHSTYGMYTYRHHPCM
jgi:hypothetical protein